MRRAPPRAILVVIFGCLGSFIVMALVAAMGPSDEAVCGSGNLLDRLAQTVMRPLGAGHIEGQGATYCVVPSTTAWSMALLALLVALAGTLLLARRAAE